MGAPGTTPGPWRVEIDNVFAGPINNAVYVADCAPMGGPVDGTPTGIANAHLIAASPALYEALEKFVAYDDSPVADASDVKMMLLYAEAINAARAALALARGDAA